MSLEAWLMLAAIICEGPIVWWFARRDRREANMDTRFNKVEGSIRKIYQKIDDLNETFATKDEVDTQIKHLREIDELQFRAIMEQLTYIRNKVDDDSKREH